jgi:hypothetical protein
MTTATNMPSVSDWLKHPEVGAPTIRNKNQTATMVMVAKVDFLLASEADCKKANLSAERGLNGKFLLPTAMICDEEKANFTTTNFPIQ